MKAGKQHKFPNTILLGSQVKVDRLFELLTTLLVDFHSRFHGAVFIELSVKHLIGAIYNVIHGGLSV